MNSEECLTSHHQLSNTYNAMPRLIDFLANEPTCLRLGAALARISVSWTFLAQSVIPSWSAGVENMFQTDSPGWSEGFLGTVIPGLL